MRDVSLDLSPMPTSSSPPRLPSPAPPPSPPSRDLQHNGYNRSNILSEGDNERTAGGLISEAFNMADSAGDGSAEEFRLLS